MKSTLVRYLLVCLVPSYVGCYNTDTVTKDQLKASTDRDIIVITKDSLEYKFSKHAYSIVGDSLSGVGVQNNDVRPGKNEFKGSIPLSKIAQIKNDGFNSRRTWFIVGASVLALSFVWLVAVGSALSVHH